jgi:heme A synthase
VGAVHTIVGFAVVALFSVGWVWGGWALLRKRPPGERFWTWLAMAQLGAGLQALLGIALLLLGRRPAALLHYVYGFGPLAVLVVAHVVAREAQRERPGSRSLQPWAAFSLASFVCFGLSLRALMTGLGLG